MQLRRVLAQWDRATLTKLSLLTFFRLILQLLDLVTIGLIGLLIDYALETFSLRERIFQWLPGLETLISFQNLVVAVALLIIGKGLLSVFLSRSLLNYLAEVSANKSSEILGRLLELNLGRFRDLSRGNIQFTLTSSTSVAFSSVPIILSNLISDVFIATSIIGLYLWSEPVIGIVLVGLLASAGALFNLISSSRTKSIGAGIGRVSQSITNLVGDFVSAYRELRLYKATGAASKHFFETRRELAQLLASQKFIAGLPRVFIEISLLLGVLGAVYVLSQNGSLLDELSTVAIGLLGGLRIAGAISPIQSSITELRLNLPMAEAAIEFLENDSSEIRGVRINHHLSNPQAIAAPSVLFEDVAFKFPDSKNLILEDVRFFLPPKSLTAVVGRSGSGKSTLVDLILGFHQPSSGRIVLGTELQPSEPTEVAHNIAFVPQRPVLISGNILENITLGIPSNEVDLRRAWQALELAHLADLVRDMPKQLLSPVGEQLDRFSGGETQRLGLARALYRKPKLLILDEVTSALDPATQQKVFDTLQELKEITRIIVAHSPLVANKADYVVVLNNGVVNGFGHPEDLRRTNLDYSRFCDPT